MPTIAQAPDDDRDETPDEQLDRNTIELLNELRIAGSGIQILASVDHLGHRYAEWPTPRSLSALGMTRLDD